MSIIKILRNTSTTMIRAPLLWFFSGVAVITSYFTSPGRNPTIWLLCLSLLLIPVTVLAQAGQIRAVQLHHEGSHTSISQIIRYSADRMSPLIVVMLAGLMLFYGIAIPLWNLARLLLPQPPRPEVMVLINIISMLIASTLMAFAQCGIVISDIKLGVSLPMVFRVLRNAALTVVTIVAVFIFLRYFVSILFPVRADNPAQLTGYLLALLIVETTQSALFTFTYLQFVQGTQQITRGNPDD